MSLRYKGLVIDVAVEEVELPDGSRMQLEVVRHPGGAAVVALDARRRVCLLRQYRHVGGGWLWELPAGKLEPGEPPADTAARELAEEAGLRAGRWQPLGSYLSSPGVFDERIHLFLASELSATPANPEPHEFIEVHWQPLETALTWCADGRIDDAKTLVGLYRAAAWLEGNG
ncbi:MAG: NUDIX hydrolase [Gammaproteobacteria bacterium]|jgi:ADP-ribose pyrophosphatase|nr:NUDIX hydrolase [Gammaproteobacteria bacterium]